MANLNINMAGIQSPNPFWLASAPPTNSGAQIQRAFDLGWGGAVWKTLGEQIINVNSRFWSVDYAGNRMMGLNNIELITARPWDTNIREIIETKKKYPKHALVVSMMIETKKESWQKAVKEVNDTGCDGIELNFGCPHGMSERGMGAAVGQVPEYIEMVTAWCKRYSKMPVIVKLTPNITDIRLPARAAKRGGADAVSLINTINSIMGVDPATLTMTPSTGGKGSHGGYCGPAVKPIALNMVAEIARDPLTAGLPISGIGGVGNWRDALDFIALGAGNVQVCTAAMVYGFKIVQEMSDGLSNYMDSMGFISIEDFRGKAVPTVSDWRYLNLNHISKAVIDQSSCIQCGRCHIACEDTSHQAIATTKNGQRHFEVREQDCVGCNLCVTVCPVPDCLTLRDLAPGEIDQRTSKTVLATHADWTTHPNNPMRVAAA